MAYATVSEVQARMTRAMTDDEKRVCKSMLDDVGVYIDAVGKNANADAKKIVSCRVVARVLGDGGQTIAPVGATQGSMSGLGYAQSWTIGGGGSVGEYYLSKADRLLLGLANNVGSHSPVEDVAQRRRFWHDTWH